MSLDWQELNLQLDKLSVLSAEQQELALQEIGKDNPEFAMILRGALEDEAGEMFETPLVESVTLSAQRARWPQEIHLEVGQQISDFLITGFLGQGGDAKVYRAYQKSLRRDVALKVKANKGEEAQILANLNHPNIVRVYSRHTHQGLQLINMQLVEGKTLSDLLKICEHSLDYRSLLKNFFSKNDIPADFPKTWTKFLIHIYRQILLGLDHAHKQGVLHLDIKPSNILIDPKGKVQLVDFGVSTQTVRSEDDVLLGGSVRFMSPEQEKALFDPEVFSQLDQRADIFSAAKLIDMFWLNGQHLYVADDELVLSQDFYSLIQRSLSQQVVQRPLSAQQCLLELGKMQWNDGFFRQVSLFPKIDRWMLKFPLFTLLMLCLLPQVIGSVMNITYDSMYIFASLEESYRMIKMELMVYYNMVAYPLAIAVFLFLSRKVISLLWQSRGDLQKHCWSLPSERREQARENLLQVPRALLIATCIGWLPGAWYFIIGLAWKGSPLSFSDQLHLHVSFGVSWAVAFCFSSLFQRFYCVGILYPFLLSPQEDPSAISKHELKEPLNSQFFLLRTASLPLLAAMVFIWNNPDLQELVLRSLAIGLILIGLFGVAFSQALNLRFARLKAFLESSI